MVPELESWVAYALLGAYGALFVFTTVVFLRVLHVDSVRGMQ